eukprot:5886954-Ditylum_brightwellii.AAC.1
MMKFGEPEIGMSEENQNKISSRMMRAKTSDQTQDGSSTITQLASKSGKRKSEEQSGANGKAQVGGNKGTISDKGNNKGKPVLPHTRAISESGKQNNTMSLTEADQKGNPTKKRKVLPQSKDMEVDNQ